MFNFYYKLSNAFKQFYNKKKKTFELIRINSKSQNLIKKYT